MHAGAHRIASYSDVSGHLHSIGEHLEVQPYSLYIHNLPFWCSLDLLAQQLAVSAADDDDVAPPVNTVDDDEAGARSSSRQRGSCVLDVSTAALPNSASEDAHGWVTFASKEHATRVLDMQPIRLHSQQTPQPPEQTDQSGETADIVLSELYLPPKHNNTVTAKIFGTAARVAKDHEQCERLAKKLDAERRLKDFSALLSEVQSAVALPSIDTDTELGRLRFRLDIFVQYLRRVHFFCYYCGTQYSSSIQLYLRCGKFHSLPRLTEESAASLSASADLSASNSLLQLFDLNIEYLLSDSYSPDNYAGTLLLYSFDRSWLSQNYVKQGERQFACLVPSCEKLFLAEEFIIKHITTRHANLKEQLVNAELQRQFFDNFLAFTLAEQRRPPPEQHFQQQHQPHYHSARGARGGRGGGNSSARHYRRGQAR